MSNTMSVSEVRRTLGSLITKLTEPTFVTWRGQVKAVLLDIGDYNAMLDQLQGRSTSAAARSAAAHEPPKDHLRAERG
jgi:PHD/YefM family antitoxin component YafN of YafNO toxin-antitoxin module